MQYNIYYIELLGEEKLKGVTIPVVVDSRRKLTSENMVDIARILNTYRTVFIRSNSDSVLDTMVYSVKGKIRDCLYASVAALFTLTEISYIREIESGENQIIVNTEDCRNKVSIMYEDMKAIGVTHEVMLSDIERKDIKETENLCTELLVDKKQPDQVTKIFYTENPNEFSKIRRKVEKIENDNREYLVVYYDEEFEMIYYHVERVHKSPTELDSRTQISFIVSYLISRGLEKSKIKNICHVLKTGQFALMGLEVQDEKVLIKMNARSIIEGILNI